MVECSFLLAAAGKVEPFSEGGESSIEEANTEIRIGGWSLLVTDKASIFGSSIFGVFSFNSFACGFERKYDFGTCDLINPVSYGLS